jgi:hypothetical protein
VTNAFHVHLVDFLGRNNLDWAVVRNSHTADVQVFFGPTVTDGIEAHIKGLDPSMRRPPRAPRAQEPAERHPRHSEGWLVSLMAVEWQDGFPIDPGTGSGRSCTLHQSS